MLLAGCGGGPTPTTYDLSAPSGFGRVGGSRAALVVAEPTTVQTLDSDRVIVKDSAGALSFLGGAQWADRVPRLVQTRLVQTFENASRLGGVARPGERIVPDLQLNTDIRSLQHRHRQRRRRRRDHRQAGRRSHRARPACAGVFRSGTGGRGRWGGAVQALDRALSQVLIEIVRWAR